MSDESVAGKLKFHHLCDLFENIQSLKHRSKADAISRFISDFKAKIKNMTNSPPEYFSFYPILRLLLPNLERERSAYGIKETTFAKLYIRTLCLPKSSKDANNLQNYRTESDARSSRDFAEVVFWMLQKRCNTSSSLTVANVNTSLDIIANAHIDHRRRDVDNELSKLVKTATALEQKWIIRIILKDLKLGIGHNRLLNLFHPDASDMYDVTNSLYMICEKLTDPSVRLHELEITIYVPFRPMLSLRCDTTQINKIVTNERVFYIENKFDGERFQLHMKDGIFKYFSKNGYDYSDHFGSSYTSNGILTPYLNGCFKPELRSVILDGEMMGWNKDTNNFGSKGMTYDVKNLKPDNIHRPCFCVFDILLYNEQVLASKPLKERIVMIDSLITPAPGIIHISNRSEACGKQELLNALNLSVDKDEEGIVFKDPNSLYKPNDRKAGWWKMKLEYFEGVMSDLDVIIIGGYYGEGRRKSQISGFLMGLALDPDRPEEKPREFYSFARIASGLSDVEYAQLMQLLGDNWKPRDSGDPLKYGLFWGREKPDVWIPPKKSCIVQVRGSELAHSADFCTEYSLRFPRIQKIRDDKMWYDCMTISELRELTAGSKAIEKLSKRHLELSDISPSPKKRQRKQNFQVAIETREIQKMSELLRGLEFRVLNGNSEMSRVDIEVLIKEHGGDVAQVEGSTTYCVIAAVRPNVSIGSNIDIVTLNWLQNCLKESTLRPFTPKDMFFIKEKTKLMFSMQFDKFGDSFKEKTDIENCQQMINNNNMFNNEQIFLTSRELTSFDEEIQYRNPLSLFRNFIMYFDQFDDIYDKKSKTSRLLIEEMDFKFHGGTYSDTLHSRVTHVLMDVQNLQNWDDIKKVLTEKRNCNVLFLKKTFIKASIINSKIQPTEQFKIINFQNT